MALINCPECNNEISDKALAVRNVHFQLKNKPQVQIKRMIED